MQLLPGHVIEFFNGIVTSNNACLKDYFEFSSLVLFVDNNTVLPINAIIISEF